MLYFGLALVIISSILMFIDWMSKQTKKGKEKVKKHTEMFGRDVKEWNWNYNADTKCLNVEGKVIPISQIKYCESWGHIECHNGEKYILCAPLKPKQNERQRLVDQFKEEREKTEKREFEAKQKSVLEFAKKNGVDLSSAYQERNRYLNQAVRNCALGVAPIYEPTYTRGVVRGSLADNVATLANAQKKKEYEEMQEWKNKAYQDFVSAKRKYDAKARKIISTLKEMPNSEEYVKFEEEQYSYNMSILNKA